MKNIKIVTWIDIDNPSKKLFGVDVRRNGVWEHVIPPKDSLFDTKKEAKIFSNIVEARLMIEKIELSK